MLVGAKLLGRSTVWSILQKPPCVRSVWHTVLLGFNWCTYLVLILCIPMIVVSQVTFFSRHMPHLPTDHVAIHLGELASMPYCRPGHPDFERE